jgi:hypothetical protein
MLALNQVLISFILFFRANIASLHLYRTDSILSVLDRLLMIGICLPLLALHIMTIHLFIIAQTLAYLITLLAALTILWKQGAPLQFRWEKPPCPCYLQKKPTLCTLHIPNVRICPPRHHPTRTLTTRWHPTSSYLCRSLSATRCRQYDWRTIYRHPTTHVQQNAIPTTRHPTHPYNTATNSSLQAPSL